MPFCFHKCHYCDFYSIVDTRDRQDAFAARLIRELNALAPLAAGAPLSTIFVGGGTPSLLRPGLWRMLLERLNELFDLSAIRAGLPMGEFTVECNPETVTAELAETLRAGGVTRVSMGAQSFVPRHLKTLERWHDPASVTRALEVVRRAGIGRQSIDLIYGVPGQTLDEWRHDVRTAVSLGTEHLSCYSLTYEPNTAMTARLKRGEFSPIDDDTDYQMHLEAEAVAAETGMRRYEVSNFALPGAECRHNLAYWRQEQWLAAGPSASAHAGGHRWKNTARLDDYLSIDDEGFAPISEHEPPDDRRALVERLMTGVRISEGLPESEVLALASRLGPDVESAVAYAAERLRNRGLLAVQSGRWAPTANGMLVADAIALEFLEAIDHAAGSGTAKPGQASA